MYSPLEFERKILIHRKLGFYMGNKSMEGWEHVNFRTNKIDPHKTIVNINKYHKIHVYNLRKNMTHTKTSEWIISKHIEARLPCKEKGKYLLLPSLQGAQSNDNEENSLVLFK